MDRLFFFPSARAHDPAVARWFDDRPGPVRDALASSVNTWLAAMQRAIEIAVVEGHLRADTDAGQMGFEIHALILALHYEARFLNVPGAAERDRQGFARILERYRTPDQAPQRKR